MTNEDKDDLTEIYENLNVFIEETIPETDPMRIKTVRIVVNGRDFGTYTNQSVKEFTEKSGDYSSTTAEGETE